MCFKLGYMPRLPPNLKFLDVSLTKVNDDITGVLPNSLEKINLLLVRGVKDLFYTLPSNLKELNAQGTAIDNDCIVHLPRGLRTINLSACSNITADGIAKLQSSIQCLIYKKSRILHGMLASVPDSVTKLSLHGNEFTSDMFNELHTNITHLSLLECNGLNTMNLMHLDNLRYLDVSDCGLVNKHLEILPPSIEHLRLYNNTEISDNGIKNLQHSNITYLDISSTSVTSECLSTLPSKLCVLKIYYVQNITIEELRSISTSVLIYCNRDDTNTILNKSTAVQYTVDDWFPHNM